MYSNNKSIETLSDCLFLKDQGYKRQPINLSKFEYNHIFASIMGKEYNSNEMKQNENFENLKIESLNRDSENWVISQSQIENTEVPSNTSTQSNISNSIQTQKPINIVESRLNKKLETSNENSLESEEIEINEFEKCSYFEDETLQLKSEYLYSNNNNDNNNTSVEIVWERLKAQEKQYYTSEVYNFYISKCKICISPYKTSNEWIYNQKVPLVFIRKNILDELSNLIWLQRMRNEILFTSIYYFDNTLCKDNFFWNITAIEEIRELAYSCVYLAAKVEEVVHISHKELCKRSSIPSKTILNLERHILKVLTFKLNPPIPITFLQLLLEMYKAKKVQNFGNNNSKKILEYYICSYILEICLYDIELMQYSPLEQALAAIYVARQCIEFNCNKEKNYIISLCLDQVEIKGNIISNFKYDYNLKNQYRIVESIIRTFQYSHIINTITTKKYQSKEYMGAADYVLKALSLNNNNNNTISISSSNKKKIGNK
ncbi:cyclin, N-terminal domain-containing protein [Cryptosporidium muris RN66]|uniref:Cyclin, N-terminal domain-containing protein n=1 Tax=Cryptosporidium muris (strain RN66) TaxID=441375 RepID=B6ACN3_CRYMR|nr:cyclin, N-terminal domain-containing protein [Cryptosporidium muris RN66]EEA05887.1 cyclin, N-terminal domain-containing protein [Cryptosporidium muris RN66]|eukprot:XP_002140236.1 cyclin, N-terminal domain-containing protein [Cryptosporidium muris RN66]